jgi:hypothetical protein
MPAVGLVLALGLSIGLASQSCNVSGTDLTIDDLRDHVVVTNASASEDASVNIFTPLANVDLYVLAGSSRTVYFLAARKYIVEVQAQSDPSGVTYKQGLLDLRDRLVALSLHPDNPSADVAGALVELSTVEAALQQMHGSQGSQSCTAAIKTGVDGAVTAAWNPSAVGGAGAWTLTCG